MIDFDFRNPTRIIFGKNSEEKVGALLNEYSLKRVLIVYGGGSIKKNGLYDKVISILDKADIFHVELGGITPNPDRHFLSVGVRIARENGIQGILAIGGGSVIDVSKGIGVGFYYDNDPFAFNLHKAKPSKTLPVGVILTIASAGSESSNSCVISDEKNHVKSGFNDDMIRPVFAIEDPALTFSVSHYQTAAGITDIMMHSLERYFDDSGEYQLSDDWALSLCKNVKMAGEKALDYPSDYEARAALMLASSLSHDGLTSIGKKQSFVVHPLEHALSGYKNDVTHGAGIAICFLGWASYFKEKLADKLARLGSTLFDIHCEDTNKAAIMTINAMKDFYVSIGMPTSLREVGIKEDELETLANIATGNGTRVVGLYPQPLDRQAVLSIYRNCY